MHRFTRPLVLIAGTSLAVMVGLTAWGQGDRSAGQVLHQDIEPPAPEQGGATERTTKPMFGPEPAEGQNPSAFAEKGKILPEPDKQKSQSGDEPVHGRSGFAVDRNTSAQPDYNTGSDDTLQYVEVFNPSVLPFKRMSAMDAVQEDYTLYTANSSVHQDIPVGGSQSPERDMFWGSLMIELRPGEDVPIPSVAPDMRILSYEIQPTIAVRFSKDGADNYYAASDESSASGTYRLVFLADADAGYFAPKVPTEYKVRDVARFAPPGLLKKVPADVQRIAEKAHEELGIDPSTRLDIALEKLTYYFRSFEAKDPPSSSGNVYWDLFASQAGVCRHRSFAFMITANALGLPTRYLTNEAHAWVEVWVPQAKWMRIDLGGAALRMNVENAGDKTLYQPRGEDPFAQPPSYENNYTMLEGDINGLTDQQIAERREPANANSGTSNRSGSQRDRGATGDPMAGGDRGAMGDRGATGELGDGSHEFDPGPPELDRSAAIPGPAQLGLGAEPDAFEDPAAARKVRTQLMVTQSDSEAYRGESINISGELRGPGEKGVGGQRVDIWLRRAGGRDEDARLIGHTVTEADGSYVGQIALPADLALGPYEIVAVSPGDTRHAPTVSE